MNNPTNNELGFSLKNEILTALKPLLEKAKKTNHNKFRGVIENFLSAPEETGIGAVKKYLPALGIFSTVMSLVGNLVIVEKTITHEDLAEFTSKIRQYFSQYEKLNTINEQFSLQVQELLGKTQETKDELRDFLIDCIYTFNNKNSNQMLKEQPLEILIQQYYDPQKLQNWFDTSEWKHDSYFYPPDAPTSARLLTSGIRKLQKEFESQYKENYSQLKELLTSLQNTIPNPDIVQLEKTNTDLYNLYHDSRQADLTNMNIMLVDERMNTMCRIINAKKLADHPLEANKNQ